MNAEARFRKLKEELDSLWEELNSEREVAERNLKSQIETLEKEKADLEEKYMEVQSKLTHIEEQFKEAVEKLETFSKEQKKDVDALKLLDIYLVLMGDVFNSSVHVRLLLILHGEKAKYTLEELAKASGSRLLVVRQAIFDLRNANLVKYNDDTQEVELVTRFLE
ncbi:MAG: hypothetical protein D6732_15090 [Methanobacteriota archaeon]|nr:MAG: hypothetical protein D6732_15090 [Euryarchaeota archaeon]